ncbi:MAG: GNAT family N-acetyltransferase [Acidobacteriia bacterium]|nr:GNAT family N-acetyltransferase [Terriglobia bacterium]
MQIVTPALPSEDDSASRAVLRDGTVATLRLAQTGDREILRRFFHDLSPESRRRRFHGYGEPTDALLDRLSDSSDLSRAATLLVLRVRDGESRPIAVGSFVAIDAVAAEAAFAVDDQFQGRGLGTILLERLAAIAAAHGFRRFDAMTLADNSAMLEVFHDSGFEIRSKSDSGAINVQLSLSPTIATVAAAERREALATAASLRPMLEPTAVAVVGASRDPGSIGHRILRALTGAGFAGPIYPINPQAAEIDGHACYPSVTAAPRGVDLAIIAVPKQVVLRVVDECAAAGVKSLVVITAGFAEAGDDGRALQHQLTDKVRGYGLRMVGPNCMGLLNATAEVRLNASFSPIVPPSGRVAFSSQSGALGLAILALASERGVGLSTFVSVGNKADVSSNDLLQYWEADPHTSVILLYLESFGNPRRFARLARRIARKKPIVAVKAGRTRAGSRAAGSHTAALAASDTAVDALFHQSGVIRADTIDEMFDLASCLEAQPLPSGRRIAIVTNAGGPGILAVDACEAAGLQVTPFSPATRQRLAAFLPAEASVGNPVDMVASAGPNEYRRAVEAVLTAEETDALIVIYTPVDATRAGDTLHAIREGVAAGRHAGATGKPILMCVMADGNRPQPLIVEGERIPAYAFPENAARALAKVATHAEWRAKPAGLLWSFENIRAEDARTICRTALDARGEGWLSSDETHALLGAFGLPLAAGTMAHSADEAAALALVLGFPVAVKLAARGLPHKTDAGVVRLNVTSDQSVRRAFTDIMTRARKLVTEDQIDGVLIQSMITGGVETMIGATEDPLFGPLVAFGLGGIHVEILGDVRFRIAPLTDRDADELLHEIRGLPLLQGYRGHPPADLDALRELLLRVSRLAVEVPEIVELDLNPVMAMSPGHGCRIVDARVKVRAHP